MAYRAAADIRLRDLVHRDGRHHAAEEAGLFDGVLKSDGIDDGRQHAHMVGGDAVHVDGLLGDAAEEVAAADDDGDLATGTGDLGNLIGDRADEDGIDAEAAARGQGFSRELEEYTLIHSCSQCTGRDIGVIGRQAAQSSARVCWTGTCFEASVEMEMDSTLGS